MEDSVCPKCGASLGPITGISGGRQIRRCSRGSWNSSTHKTEGCEYVLWLETPPQTLEEACPKCGSPLVMATTRFGKKLKKCSTSGWDKDSKKATGCDYVEWINGTTEALSEPCPDCGSPLVLFTTNAGKKLKKCSTSGWDKDSKKATGCTYVQWLKAEPASASYGEEFLPPEPASP